jgi:pimeloyl-ACP methyl ester carboxylesterase
MLLGDAEKAARQLMHSIPDTDKAVLYASQNAESFVSSVREGLRRGSRGVALDDILINQEWGFDLSGVRPRIDIWHGDADVNVPVHAAQHMADVLVNAHVKLLPGEGHFFIMDRWGEILLALVDDRNATGEK